MVACSGGDKLVTPCSDGSYAERCKNRKMNSGDSSFPSSVKLLSFRQSLSELGRKVPENLTSCPVFIDEATSKMALLGSRRVLLPMSDKSLFHVSTFIPCAMLISNTPLPSLFESIFSMVPIQSLTCSVVITLHNAVSLFALIPPFCMSFSAFCESSCARETTSMKLASNGGRFTAVPGFSLLSMAR